MTTSSPLAVIEQLDANGQVLRVQPITQWPCHVGRAIDCDFLVHDPYVAPHHAELEVNAQGQLMLRVGVTLNGIQVLVNHNSLHVPTGHCHLLASEQLWCMGLSTYRVRLAGSLLAPEQVLPEHLRRATWQGALGSRVQWRLIGITALWALALVLWLILDKWLDSSTQTRFIEYAKPLLYVGGGLSVWTMTWAMVSKLFTHRSQFLSHLRCAISWLFLAAALSALLPLLGAMWEMLFLSKIAAYAGCALLCVMLAQHLTLLLPARRTWIQRGMGLLFVVGAGSLLLLNHQQYHRYFREPYMATLVPPSWRWAQPQTLDQLLSDARKLQASLLERAAQDDESSSNP